jgi:hypothetical protein
MGGKDGNGGGGCISVTGVSEEMPANGFGCRVNHRWFQSIEPISYFFAKGGFGFCSLIHLDLQLA